MNKEFLYMQKLAGIITEGEYKEKVKVNEDLSGHFSPVAKELETYLKSKGFENIKTSKGSSDAKKEIEGSESENKFHGSFAIQNNPDLKGKNKTAFITTEPVFHEDVKSFMVFLPHDREDLKGEIETKFSANPASGGAGVYYSFFIPAEKQSVKESLKTSLKTILKEILAEAANTNLKDFALKELRKGVYDDFAKWKESFEDGTEFPQEKGYVIAKKDGKEVGKWNSVMQKGMHADDFQYKSLEEKEQTNELFGLGAKIEVRDKKDKSKMVKVGSGDLVVYKPQFSNSGYSNENEGVYMIGKIKHGKVFLKQKMPREYQTNLGAESRDISGMFASPGDLAYYGKK